MAEGQGTTATATQDKKGGAPVQDDGKGYLTPMEKHGNRAGNSIESALSPVGSKVGKGFEVVTKPVGGVVDGVVGGLMRSGEAFGAVTGVGYGNKKQPQSGEKGEEKVEKEGGTGQGTEGGGKEEGSKGGDKKGDEGETGMDDEEEDQANKVGGKG